MIGSQDLVLIARKVLVGIAIALLPLAIVLTALWTVQTLLGGTHATG